MIQLAAPAFRGAWNGSEREGAAHPRSPPLCLPRRPASQPAPCIFLRPPTPTLLQPRPEPCLAGQIGETRESHPGRDCGKRGPQASPPWPKYRPKVLSAEVGHGGPHSSTPWLSAAPLAAFLLPVPNFS